MSQHCGADAISTGDSRKSRNRNGCNRDLYRNMLGQLAASQETREKGARENCSRLRDAAERLTGRDSLGQKMLNLEVAIEFRQDDRRSEKVGDLQARTAQEMAGELNPNGQWLPMSVE